MSVDKFGRYETGVRKAGLRGPPGVGFKTTAEGDYDMMLKRLRMVGHPKDAYDAVTVNYVNDICLHLDSDGKFNADEHTIRNLKEPVEQLDAVNKTYVDRQTPTRGKDEWNFDNMRLGNVSEPKTDTDGVNLSYIKNKVLDPLNSAVERIPKRDKSEWNFDSLRLGNLAGPKKADDAVTKAYFDRNAPTRGSGEWKFGNTRLTGVASPQEDDEVVNLKYIRENVLRPLSYVKGHALASSDTNNAYDAKGNRVINVADATLDGDAVNLHLVNALNERLETKINDVLNKVEDELSGMAFLIAHRFNDPMRRWAPPSKLKPWRRNFAHPFTDDTVRFDTALKTEP